MFEVLLPGDVQKHAVLNEVEPDSEGYVYAYNEPGLGVDIDYDLIEKNKLGELS